MKRFTSIQYIFTAALFAVTLPACNDYLDVAPQGQIEEEAIRNNPSAAFDLVTGVYNSMWQGGFGPDVHSFRYVIATNIASDDADKGSTPQDFGAAADIDNFTSLNPGNVVLDDLWKGYYQAIGRANQALDKLPLSPVDDSTKNQLTGEVRFLRGYFYFNLVRFFGGVPKIDRIPGVEEVDNPEFQTRASADTIYQFIIDDLTFATNNLPPKGRTEAGRITLGAAQAMLAKVYLYRQNYEQVYQLTNQVITGGLYALVQNYELIWREDAVNGDGGNNNSESIFEVQAGVNTACNSAINIYAVCQGPRAGGAGGWRDLGFGFNNPSQSLLDEYEPNDVRREGTIIFINEDPAGTVLFDGFRIPSKDSVENFRYNYKAYHSRTAESNCGNIDRLPKQLRVQRYADVLLMNAEAAFQTGRTGEALLRVNEIRERAGLDPLTAVTLEAIWKERRLELAMEHDRFFDLVRQETVQPGRATQAFAAHGKTWVKGINEVFPIPQTQIDLSGGRLEQNPGY